MFFLLLLLLLLYVHYKYHPAEPLPNHLTHSTVTCEERDAEGQLRHFDAVAGAVAVGCSALAAKERDGEVEPDGKRWENLWKTMENCLIFQVGDCIGVLFLKV
jgi:hypothetical protein